mmetsp:Transcript_26117/g.60665  ORF Transcript_26117/g.60665 Transcript_26117/m.60665 type:complete len:213 (+) Transcript_26117:134-772(+)
MVFTRHVYLHFSNGSLDGGDPGDAREARRLGTMSVGVLERLGVVDSFSTLLVQVCINPWFVPLTETIGPLLEGCNNDMELGNVESAFICFNCYVTHSFTSGLSLGPLVADTKARADFIRDYNVESVLYAHLCTYQAILSLTGLSEDPLKFKGDDMDEDSFVQEKRATYRFTSSICTRCRCADFMVNGNEQMSCLRRLKKPRNLLLLLWKCRA